MDPNIACGAIIATAIIFLLLGYRLGRGLSPIASYDQWPMLRNFVNKPPAKPEPKPIQRDKF